MHFSTSDTKIDTKILLPYKWVPTPKRYFSTHILKYFHNIWDTTTVLKWAYLPVFEWPHPLPDWPFICVKLFYHILIYNILLFFLQITVVMYLEGLFSSAGVRLKSLSDIPVHGIISKYFYYFLTFLLFQRSRVIKLKSIHDKYMIYG